MHNFLINFLSNLGTMAKRSTLSSARVPHELGILTSSTKTEGTARGDDDSSQQDDVDDEDEAERAKGEAAWTIELRPLGFFPLFIDGISDLGILVGYPQIIALFTKIGRIGKHFVQRNWKAGRRFRFGFVHFFSRSCSGHL